MLFRSEWSVVCGSGDAAAAGRSDELAKTGDALVGGEAVLYAKEGLYADAKEVCVLESSGCVVSCAVTT